MLSPYAKKLSNLWLINEGLMKFNLFILLVLCSFSHLFGEESNKDSLEFAGLPALGFGPDTGFGFGAIGRIYVKNENYFPYKMSLGAKIYLTTKGVHSHAFQFDAVRPFKLPMRVLSRVGFFKTNALNYCGRASDAACDENQAATIAREKNLPESEQHLFINNYYKHRFMSFFGDLSLRWLLWESKAKLELMTNYRGSYYLNGDFVKRDFYPGSLFQRDHQNEKTEGYLSTLELGLMLDNRDNEAAPSEGYWLESSIRGGALPIGSAWNHFGANLSARVYFPLDEEHRLVVASQSIADAIVGNMPFDALSRVGGSQAFNDFTAIGGQYLGRGIKEQRFVGRLKFIEQAEFRYGFWAFTLLKQHFDLVSAIFGDFAMTAWDYSRLKKDLQNLYIGFGGGLRIYWNKNFVVRADYAMSPSENFSPKFYLVVGNVF